MISLIEVKLKWRETGLSCKVGEMCSAAQRLHANSYHSAQNLNNHGPVLFVTVAYGLPIAGAAEAVA